MLYMQFNSIVIANEEAGTSSDVSLDLEFGSQGSRSYCIRNMASGHGNGK